MASESIADSALGLMGYCLRAHLGSRTIVNYLVDLFINKLKTKFNNLFLQNHFKYEKLTTPSEQISPARATQMPSKV